MPQSTAPWHDTSLSAADRAALLLAELTLDEKIAQLGSSWPGAESAEGDVAPMQETHLRAESFDVAVAGGLGQITRVFGTSPIAPGDGQRRLQELQDAVISASRFGIPAVAHEECLTGVTAWQATVYPTPLAWGASFDPDAVAAVAARIGSDLHDLGVQQGLSPVLDVVRDYRWGRVEETIGEDPFLVGEIGAAYVSGLEGAGIVATPKHFAGYSASRGARNHAPVSMGPRELADVILPPFARAMRTARSVMNAYNDIDGIPAGADAALLTGVLRDAWGFDGTVVSDYWAVPFLETMHSIAADEADAARLAITGGIDVELPHRLGFLHLHELVGSGRLSESVIDRAVERVLRQKAELGLLDEGWRPPVREGVDLNSDANRRAARELAERSVVLVRNDDLLPLRVAPARIAVIGPVADDPAFLFGCYSFPNHVLPHHPDKPLGIDAPTYLTGIRDEFPDAVVVTAEGTSVRGGETDGFDEARQVADGADLVLLFVGDRSGMFGHGTSGEGCDATDLALPGSQSALLEHILDSPTPVVVVASTGRPYALGSAPQRARSIVQTFFPGQEGARAIAGVLSGRVAPSGRLPVQIPALTGSQPSTYLAAPLALRSDGVSNIDPSPAYPFGHGLAYTRFERALLSASASTATRDGEIVLVVEVHNTGRHDGTDVVQVYASYTAPTVVQPVRRLVAFTRVDVPAGGSRQVRLVVPADAFAYSGRDGVRAVHPGRASLRIASDAADRGIRHDVVLTGHEAVVDPRTERYASAIAEDLAVADSR